MADPSKVGPGGGAVGPGGGQVGPTGPQGGDEHPVTGKLGTADSMPGSVAPGLGVDVPDGVADQTFGPMSSDAEGAVALEGIIEQTFGPMQTDAAGEVFPPTILTQAGRIVVQVQRADQHLTQAGRILVQLQRADQVLTQHGRILVQERVVPEASFDNGTLFIGLTWLILTTRSGTQFVWSDRPLPDRAQYYLGWKEPRVMRWGRIRRALSTVLDGQYETSDFSLTLDDSDRLLRQLDADKELVNATVTVYMIDDAGRRAEATPRTVYRGVVRDAKPKGTLAYELQIKDTFAEKFSAKDLHPQRIVTTDDFPNCNVAQVSCSATGYAVNGAFLTGVDVVDIDGGEHHFAPGQKFTFSGHLTVYTVSALDDPVTTLRFSPALTADVADNETIALVPSFTVEPAAGKRVPFGYGFITDRKLISGDDAGDGQGPLLYVGDRVCTDGKTRAQFIWVGHACHAGGSGTADAFVSPFAMLYFWNNPLEFAGVVAYSGVQVSIGDLATEAGSGGRIAMPGYDLWNDLGFANTYVDYNGRRYTTLFLGGILRDMALGILPAPDLLGGVPFGCNAYGAAVNGDGSGGLITNGLLQYLHAVKNWIPPKGECYQAGDWLAAPTFPDDPTLSMIDEASFAAADAQSKIYTDALSPGSALGFRGDFLVGANNETTSARNLIADFNRSFGVQCGFNRKTQFFVTMVNRDLSTTTQQPALGYVRDIFAGTFEIEPLTRDLWTAVSYRHTRDYLGRAQDGWRSVMSGEVEVENTGATGAYGAKTTFATYTMPMVRGKNRDIDADDYDRGSLTATCVLALTLARVSEIQHLPKFQTGPGGFSYELGDVAAITHYEGVGSGGYVGEPVRVERHEVDPSEFVTNVESYDLEPMLE